MREDGRIELIATHGDRKYTAMYPHAFPAVAALIWDGSPDDPDTRAIEADAPLPAAARAIDRLELDRPIGYARLRARFTVLCGQAWGELQGGTGGELDLGKGAGPTIAALSLTGMPRPGGPSYESGPLSRAFPPKIKGWWVRGSAPDWSDTDEDLVRQVEQRLAEFRHIPVEQLRAGMELLGEIGALAYSHPQRPDLTQWLFIRRSPGGSPEIGHVAEYRRTPHLQRAPFGEQLRWNAVAVVGCGALGWSIALSLARAGVGRLALFDGDVVHAANLPRLGARMTWVGTAKVTALAAEIREAAPGTLVGARIAYVGEQLGARALISEKPDLIIDASAEARSPAESNLAAVALGKPVLYAWTSPGVLAARLFRVIPGRTPCYECLRQARIQPIRAGRLVSGWTEQFVWNGANFNLDMVAAAATRMAVRTLLGDEVTTENPDHVVLDLGGPVPRMRAVEYDRSPECEVCS